MQPTASLSLSGLNAYEGQARPFPKAGYGRVGRSVPTGSSLVIHDPGGVTGADTRPLDRLQSYDSGHSQGERDSVPPRPANTVGHSKQI